MATNPVNISSNYRSLQRRIQKLPDKGYSKLRREFAFISEDFISRLKDKYLTGRPGLNRRSGALASSFKFLVFGSSTMTLRSVIFTGSKYAPIHQFGGVIRAKNFPYLYIPVRKGSEFALRAGLSKKRVSHSSQVLSFRLVKQVTIPKRLHFLEMWQSPENVVRIKTRLSQAMSEAIEETTRG